jgi:microcystin-dependent protein
MADAFLGEVRAFPYLFAPQGWAPCQGQLMQAATNTALYSLIGNTYGGTAPTSFALPNIPPFAGKEGTLQYCIAILGVFPPRAG